MQFGKVSQIDTIDLSLPKDHIDTLPLLNQSKKKETKFHIGCAKWNKQELKGFYPRGIKDELSYYASQFNCIELNATFYKLYSEEQFQKWYHKTPKDFVFFPKIIQDVSHHSRLKKDSYLYLDSFLKNVSVLEEKLGIIFLQMHNNFSPNNFSDLRYFIENWPKNIRLAIELRHTDWFNTPSIAEELFQLFQENGITNIITDTAGRRDLIHMRLTTPNTFIRWVGTNHISDYKRLDDWTERLKIWSKNGAKEINFFIHQNIELESPLLSQYFIKKLNKNLGLDLKVPLNQFDIENQQQRLF